MSRAISVNEWLDLKIKLEAAEARAAELQAERDMLLTMLDTDKDTMRQGLIDCETEKQALQAWARVWKKCARRYHDKANIVICTYCGHEGQKDKEAMVEHMSVCEKRPDREDWETLREAIAKNTTIEALQAEVERLLTLIKQAEDYSDHYGICATDWSNTADCTCGYVEWITEIRKITDD